MNSAAKLHINEFGLLIINRIGVICPKMKKNTKLENVKRKYKLFESNKSGFGTELSENANQKKDISLRPKILKFHITGEAHHLTPHQTQ